MHYFIIIVVLVVIIVFQLRSYVSNLYKISEFRNVFPEDPEETWCVSHYAEAPQIVSCSYENELGVQSSQLEKLQSERDSLVRSLMDCDSNLSDSFVSAESQEQMREALAQIQEQIEKLENPDEYYDYSNGIRAEIVNSINSYLSNNAASVSDFHLIKDIVDRNCDACEEEIQTLTPIPLYLGLMGTMAGIIVGVGYLVWSGDLDSLLESTKNLGGSHSGGIQALLSGVAIAMICSIVGLLLTVSSSLDGKDALAACEKGKHRFLTWLQAELLPVMNTDASSAMRQMTENLMLFNNTFSANTRELKSALGTVLETSRAQAHLVNLLETLDINRLATANVKVYDSLRGCTDEIGALANNLSASASYLQQVNELASRLKDADDRLRMVEEMARFFREERANLERMDSVVAQSVGNSHLKLKQACEDLQVATASQISALTAHSQEQFLKFKSVVEAETEAASSRVQSLAKLTEELQKMADVKKAIGSMEASVRQQAEETRALRTAVLQLAEAKTTGQFKVSFPLWMRVLGGVCCSLVILFLLFVFGMFILGFYHE